ncbi:MAG TPA: hypothetical protein VKB86_09195 [Pyrinomonadaceae bacterium]|nr:hypothetical protein [Pyrinomonadaceae bacterium]
MDKQEELPAIPNAHYEALLKMRSNNPSAWRVLSPNTKLAVQYYEAAKREHERIKAMREESNLPPAI